MMNNFNYLHHLTAKIWKKIESIFMFPEINSDWQGENIYEILLIRTGPIHK